MSTKGPLGHETIGAAIRAAHGRGQPAVVAFMTAGFPVRERFTADLARVASAAARREGAGARQGTEGGPSLRDIRSNGHLRRMTPVQVMTADGRRNLATKTEI